MAIGDAARRGPMVAPGGERRRELWLSLFALLVVAAADWSVAAGTGDTASGWLQLSVATLAGLTAVTHVALRRWAPAADPSLLPIVVVINGLGILEIHRLDVANQAVSALRHHRAPRADAPLQLIWMAMGVALFIAVLGVLRDHRNLARLTYTFGLAGLVLLVLPALLPARFSQVNGAKLWIRIGGLSFQPAEFGKVALLIFFAGYLTRKREQLMVLNRRFVGLQIPRGRDVGPLLAVWGVTLVVLYLEHDLGTALLFFGLFLGMLYVATARASWLVIGLLLFTAAAVSASKMSPVVQERIFIWLHPFADPYGRGYQLIQGLIGLASGGLTGTGLGRGTPQVVPFASTDFIITSIGEELGTAGLMAILVIFMLLISRALNTALQLPDDFGKLLATGIATILTVEVFLVVGGVTRLIPLTGKTTPWLSYGGSSLLGNYILLALLARLSHQARAARGPSDPQSSPRPEPEPEPALLPAR